MNSPAIEAHFVTEIHTHGDEHIAALFAGECGKKRSCPRFVAFISKCENGVK
jgi:hypothetical protein